MASLNISKLWGEARKAVIAAVGGLAEIASMNILHGTAAHVVAAILAVATALGVWKAPNKPAS